MIARSNAAGRTEAAQPAGDVDRHEYRYELSGSLAGGWDLYDNGPCVASTTGPLSPIEAMAWAKETLGGPVVWLNGRREPDNESGYWVADDLAEVGSGSGSRPMQLLAVLAAIVVGVGLVLHVVGPATSGPAGFAAVFAALFAAHLVGDYWIQTDHQARCKGDVLSGPHRLSWAQRWQVSAPGWAANLSHVATYTATAATAVALVAWRTGLALDWEHVAAGLAVSAATHAWADRRHTLAWLVRLTGNSGFYATTDGPRLLDQSWHVGWLLIAALIAS